MSKINWIIYEGFQYMREKRKSRKNLQQLGNARIKRRRQKKIKCLIRKLFFLFACMFCIFQLKPLVAKFKSVPNNKIIQQEIIEKTITTNENNQKIKSDSKWAVDLEALAKTEPRAEEILKNINVYPDNIIELYLKHNEAIDFVYSYPKLKNIQATADSIDLSKDVTKGRIPLFFQWDTRWGYNIYGTTGIIALDGCGPTCLSMVMVGLTGDLSWNPIKMAEFSHQNGYYDESNGTSWGLMNVGAQKLGLSSEEISLNEAIIIRKLSEGSPIICSMRPGDFTTTGHFIVLYGYENGKILLNDPNSLTNSQRKWTFSELDFQIKNLWAFSY